ncbi:nitrate- and nitrite sensing domain-containing protein [Streptomyces dengpaensis]|uniref:sensor histidine kinase n=1 Tax=Streptomyces dengpaensis TaxID=2049881 RepID=UPI00142DE36B|nr:nitrate- and nitrite sensing domain-containing protein [Streptomyces dengpaensis]
MAAVWGGNTVQTLSEGLDLREQARLGRSTDPRLNDVRTQLETELRKSAAWLNDPAASPTELRAERTATDASIKSLRDLRHRIADAPAHVRTSLMPFLDALEQFPLRGLRQQIDNRTISDIEAIQKYQSLIALEIASAFSAWQVPQGSLVSDSQPLSMLIKIEQAIQLEDAVVSGALPSGQMSPAQRVAFMAPLGLQRSLMVDVGYIQSPADRAALAKITQSAEWQNLVKAENYLIAAPVNSRSGVPLSEISRLWRPALDRVESQFKDMIDASIQQLLSRQADTANSSLLHEGLLSLFGLLAVLFSAVLAWRVSSSLLHRMAGLRTATLELADNRLPDLVSRLNRGETVDVEAEAAALELDYGTDQVGQVAQAFNAVQRTGIRSAVDLVDARRGFQNAILIIARRTQNLVDRQLELLDRFERKHQEPDVLEDLYQLDSQASQLRRYEENLLIISGDRSSRRSVEPVPLPDVVRSAAGEVSEYQRVTVTADDEVNLVGTAVADVVHLVAELVENAVKFSPSICPVIVRAGSVGKGAAVEIEDRGIGMTEREYAAANRRLAEPPSFDLLALGDDSRLGMFVIAWLVNRRGLRVTLRPSAFGGTSAVVVIPEALLVRDAAHEGAQPDIPALRDVTAVRPTPSPEPADAAGRRTQPRSVVPPTPLYSTMANGDGDGDGSGNGNGDGKGNGDGDGSGNGDGDGNEQVPVGEQLPDALPPLPNRTPQASLAQELRHAPDSAVASDPSGGQVTTAERSARTMSAFQSGTARSRHRKE